ncbi:MAG: hypothetical protein ACJ779_01585, partial [Chloroflexota bacterium]
WGGWLRRRSDDLLPWFLFTAILFAGAMIVFPLHVPGGAFIHTAVGLGPYAYILALEGVAALVIAIARRRPAWDPRQAIPVFSWTIVGLVVASGLLFAPVVQAGWRADATPRRALATELDRRAVPATDRLMSIDAAGFKYFTGRGGVVSPDDPIDTIGDVAHAYDIRWLILERGGTVEALQPVLEGTTRPGWIGAPAFTIPAADGAAPTLALYPVCFDAADTRCTGTP